MTFEEYKERRQSNEPRSWPVTLFMATIAGMASMTLYVFIADMMTNGITFINSVAALISLSIGVYATICAFDGKRKTAREALYDLFIVWPFI